MQEGIKTLTSHHSVDETVARLEALLKEKGVKLFCVVDHSGEAAAAGLSMPTTRLLIFGSPKAGTPIMLAAPTAALDLPLKILVAEAPDGTVQLYSSRLVQTVTVTGFETEAVKKLLAANKWAEPKINVTIEIDDSGLVVVSKAIAEVEVEEPKTTKSTTASTKKAKDSKKKKTYLGK